MHVYMGASVGRDVPRCRRLRMTAINSVVVVNVINNYVTIIDIYYTPIPIIMSPVVGVRSLLFTCTHLHCSTVGH